MPWDSKSYTGTVGAHLRTHTLNWFCQEQDRCDNLLCPSIHIPAKAALTAQTQPQGENSSGIRPSQEL